MRDWERYVRGHLSLSDLTRERESRMVRELASQLEDFYHDAIAGGMTETDADAHARAQITDWQRLADSLRGVDRVPARRRQLLVADLRQDIRYAARRLAAHPAFTAVAVLTLGLGIGLGSLLFAFLNGLVLQPLPGAGEPERLVTLQASVPYPYFAHYRDHGRMATAMTAFLGPVPFNVSGGGAAQPERLFGHIVSPDYFATLGVEPRLGRLFARGADPADLASAVVVSERFWRTRLQADPSAIGRTLRINAGRATIIGVAAKDFAGVFPVNPVDLFLPVTADPALAPELAGDVLTTIRASPFRVVMRLAPGETLAQAREAIDAQRLQIDRQFGRADATHAGGPRTVLFQAGGLMPMPAAARNTSLVFFGVLILLILALTCANLAGLLLARGDARGHEMAVRLALGASRFRLVRQLLIESLLLALAGGLAGFTATGALLALLVHTLTRNAAFAPVIRLTPDLRVTLVTFAIAALAGMAFGLAPALAATRPDLLRGLKDLTLLRASRHRRFGLRNLFLVGQMTTATALTVVVGFMIAGVMRGGGVDLGVDPDRAWLFSLDLARDGYSREEAREFLVGLPDRLTAVNGIDRASVSAEAPFPGGFATTQVTISNPDGRESMHSVALERIGPGFFATLGLPLLRGVEFGDDQLRATAAEPRLLPVVINHTAARQLFGDRDPLGAVIGFQQQRLQVIGVARYGKPPVFASEPAPTILLPLTAADLVPGPPQGLTVIVSSRAGMSPATMANVLARLDAHATAFNLRTLHDGLAQQDRGVRFVTGIYSILGIFGIALASIGLAGVTAQAVVRRRKEIGIRMALGAPRASLLRLVMGDAIVMVSLGVILGLAGAYILGRVLIAMNTEFGRTVTLGGASPWSVLAAPLLLMLIASLTSYLPARQSSAIDPLITLREE